MLDSSHQSKRFAFCCRPHLASGNNLHRGPALRNATGISHPEGFHRFFKSYPHYKKRPVKDRPLFMVQGEGCASLARISLFGASSCTLTPVRTCPNGLLGSRIVSAKKNSRSFDQLLFLVAQVSQHWNLICNELLRWKQILGVTPRQSYSGSWD